MEEYIFEYEIRNNKNQVIMIKTTDEDLFNGNEETEKPIGTIKNMIDYIKNNCNKLAEITFKNFSDEQISYILYSLSDCKDIDGTIHSDTYLISQQAIKKKVIKYDKVDERTRRSNL